MGASGGAFAIGRRAILPATASLLIPARAFAAVPAPATTEPLLNEALRKLDDIAADAMRRTGIPGMAIAVVYRDHPVYLKGFGVRETGHSEPIDPDTIFPLASVSKPIASTVVAALVGEGIVAWDDPIVRHDPGFEMYDPWVTRAVTLRDMFCHRSGLPGYAGDVLQYIGYGRAAILNRLRYQKPGSSFRSRFAYTNFGLTEAAIAAAMAAGKPWEELCAERLYRPLNMRRTSSRFADFIAETNRASSHVKVDGKWTVSEPVNNDTQSPAGGVISSVRDLTSWIRLQLGRGRFDGREVVKEAPLDETHIPDIERPPSPKNPAIDHAKFYGLGWYVDYDDRGRVRWGHSGASAYGNATAVDLLPGEQLAIVTLTNAQPIGVPEAVNESFLDRVTTGKVEKDWIAYFGELYAEATKPGYGSGVDYSKPPASRSPPLGRTSYVGVYTNELYGNIAIIQGADNSSLWLKLGLLPAPLPLMHFDRDVFTYQPPSRNVFARAAVTFTVDARSLAHRVTIENLDLDGQGTFRRRAAGT